MSCVKRRPRAGLIFGVGKVWVCFAKRRGARVFPPPGPSPSGSGAAFRRRLPLTVPHQLSSGAKGLGSFEACSLWCIGWLVASVTAASALVDVSSSVRGAWWGAGFHGLICYPCVVRPAPINGGGGFRKRAQVDVFSVEEEERAALNLQKRANSLDRRGGLRGGSERAPFQSVYRRCRVKVGVGSVSSSWRDFGRWPWSGWRPC
jgi:hypothetical protein